MTEPNLDATETKGKHTPGPWHWMVHDVSMASLGVGSDPGMGTPLVLNVSPCRSCINSAAPKEWEWGRCTTPSEADARLIAAAPELLNALKVCIEALTAETIGTIYMDDPGWYQAVDDAVTQAKAAIIKAESAQ